MDANHFGRFVIGLNKAIGELKNCNSEILDLPIKTKQDIERRRKIFALIQQIEGLK
jgi:hypothetical protein